MSNFRIFDLTVGFDICLKIIFSYFKLCTRYLIEFIFRVFYVLSRTKRVLNLRGRGRDWWNGDVLSRFRRSRKYERMSKPSQPLSLSRFIAPNATERSIKRFHRRTVERPATIIFPF